MTETQAESKISEVESLRRQNAGWRIGSIIAVIAILGIGIGNVATQARSLVTPGPQQEQFSGELYTGLQRDVVPQIQQIAGRTLAETRPLVEQEFVKIGERTPELTQAATKEMEALQTNLQERGTKVVSATLVPMLEKHETKLKEMFPEATDENIQAITKTLKDEMLVQAASTHDSLFGKHITALNNIVTDMERIRLAEKVNPGTEQANWELGLAIFDIVRDDLKEMEPKAAPKTGSAPAGPAKAATKSDGTKS